MRRALPIICSLLLASCGGAPIKPSIELGVIDYPAGEVIVNMTGGKSMSRIDSVPKASYQNVVQAIVVTGNRVPLASYDHAITIKPDYWQIEVSYIHSLERYITNHCGSGN